MKVAVYVRLSCEDRDKVGEESESVVNQQLMLLSYCKEQGWDIYRIYVDEDYSGSDRDRPQFNKMLKEAEEGKFEIILTKSLSRFARDMELIEKYVNTLFPVWGIRFISLVDNADSENQANRKARQINSLVDQWYLEDLSASVKATLKAKRQAGLWVGAFAPFGYVKDPDNKNHLIIDEDAAEIVRYIYSLYLDGYGLNSIARKLNSEKIPNPSVYKKSKGQSFQNMNRECSPLWHTYSVQRILKNQIYIGDTVQGKTTSISYKSSKKKVKKKEEWDVVKNTHQPIIEKETFNRVQDVFASGRRAEKSGVASVFSRKVKCMKCGSFMRSYITGKRKYYACNLHFISPENCKGTYVSVNTLTDSIVKELQRLYELYVDENEVGKKLDIISSRIEKKECIEKEISIVKNQINKTKDRFCCLYSDKADGLLSVEDFKMLSCEFKRKEKELETRLETLEKKLDYTLINNEDASVEKKIIRKYSGLKELDRYMVELLIDYIEVGGNRKNRTIKIYWNF